MIIYHRCCHQKNCIYFYIYRISLLGYFPLLQKISRSLRQPQRLLFLHCPIMSSVCDTIAFLLNLALRLSLCGKVKMVIVGEAATYEIPPLLATNGETHNQFPFTTVTVLGRG